MRLRAHISAAIVLISTLAAARASSVVTTSLIGNAGFEAGAPVTAANQFTSFAGSPAKDANWAPVISVLEWMVYSLSSAHPLLIENSAMAKEGSRFLYVRGDISASLASFDGSGPGYYDSGTGIVQGNPSGTYSVSTADVLTAGTTYRLSLWAANAGSTVDGAAANVNLSVLGLSPSTTLVSNLSWQDNATSVIPWQQISYEFTPSSNMPLWGQTILYASTNGDPFATGPGAVPGNRLSIVVDNIQLIVVPEPTSAVLGGMFFLGFQRRRVRP